jgi:two-component system sensor histidine kinase/response regulator
VAEELVARVRAHAEARQLRQRLRRAVREREEISSMVAHDLKNPLFSIALKAGVLREQAHDPERVRELAERIEQSAQRTMAFISNYLEQRADVELRRDYQPAVCDSDLLLQVLQREFDSVLAHKRQRLLRDVQQVEPVLADVEAFGVVMRNLLSNASKYSPAGSAITLACRRGKPGHLQFAVLDEGPGIAIEDRPRLFQRFVRLSSRPTGDESSSGLGLSAALTEARWMGGELWYEEAPGGGACFVLELPLAPVV